jgi:hypothetical protein
MTNEEFDRVRALIVCDELHGALAQISDRATPDCILDDEYNQVATTIRTWRTRLKNGIEIRKKRADAGTERKS